jgi:hypothetical protein
VLVREYLHQQLLTDGQIGGSAISKSLAGSLERIDGFDQTLELALELLRHGQPVFGFDL